MVGFFVIQDKFGRCVRSAGLIGQNACLDVLSGSARISCVGARFVLIEAGAVLVGDAERLAYVLPAVLPGLPAGLLDLPAGERVGNRPAGRFGIFATLVVLPADRLDFANRARRPSLGIRITPFRAQPEDRTVFSRLWLEMGMRHRVPRLFRNPKMAIFQRFTILGSKWSASGPATTGSIGLFLGVVAGKG